MTGGEGDAIGQGLFLRDQRVGESRASVKGVFRSWGTEPIAAGVRPNARPSSLVRRRRSGRRRLLQRFRVNARDPPHVVGLRVLPRREVDVLLRGGGVAEGLVVQADVKVRV